MKIAIIGAGISGNVAAYLLDQHHDITLYEKRDRLGGHSATKDVDYDGTNIAVDTGFIVYNELNYPGLTRLFSELDIATEASNMSFGFSAATQHKRGVFEWSGNSLGAVFAQKTNIANPRFLLMLREIFRFNKLAEAAFAAGLDAGESLGHWLARHNFKRVFRDRYLLPMGAAIWSTPADAIMDFPAASFLQFFVNHRLIHADRPQWRTVSGGSRHYVARLTSAFAHRARLSQDISRVTRENGKVQITANGETDIYDAVIFATHTDRTRAMLADATPEEKSLLNAVRYAPNHVYLHRDPTLMPTRQAVWSAWNYLSQWPVQADGPVAVSYWMNLLQNLPQDKPLFVTLNPAEPPREALTFGHYIYDHPQYDLAALRAQEVLPALQGARNTYYCGAWTGYGFHEDGLQSAVRVCAALGVDWASGAASPPTRRVAAE